MDDASDLIAAELAWRLAPVLCVARAEAPVCDWYHRLWPLLRNLGLGTSPQLHGECFRATLAAMRPQATVPLRVLVSGAADHVLPALLANEARMLNLPVAITVLDICETPLALCRWYAARARLALRTHRGDVLEFAADGCFDLVCTHAFFGRFAPAERDLLCKRWHALLAPAGRLVTVNRLRPDASGQQIRFDDAQAPDFAHRVMDAFRVCDRKLIVNGEELERAVYAYAGQHRSWPVADTGEIRRALLAGGFRTVDIDINVQAQSGSGSDAGPTLRTNAAYAFVNARRAG